MVCTTPQAEMYQHTDKCALRLYLKSNSKPFYFFTEVTLYNTWRSNSAKHVSTARDTAQAASSFTQWAQLSMFIPSFVLTGYRIIIEKLCS
jgi:hypothetical protein